MNVLADNDVANRNGQGERMEVDCSNRDVKARKPCIRFGLDVPPERLIRHGGQNHHRKNDYGDND
jgi:hypothetical protein